jgi:hypothetical protein
MSKLSEKREEQTATLSARSGPQWRWIIVGLVVVGAAWSAYYFLYYRKSGQRIDAFARCLSSKNAHMFGAWWCPHCAEQKERFGSAFEYVAYTECSPQGQRTVNDTCKQAGVAHFPTWQFGDGSRQEGVMEFSELAQKTGCQSP